MKLDMGRSNAPMVGWIIGVVLIWPVVCFLCTKMSSVIVFGTLPVTTAFVDAIGLPLPTAGLYEGLQFVAQAILGFLLGFGIVRLAVWAGAPCVVWRVAAGMSAVAFVSAAVYTVMMNGLGAGLLQLTVLASLTLTLAGCMAVGACRGACAQAARQPEPPFAE